MGGININIKYILSKVKDAVLQTYYIGRYSKSKIDDSIILFDSKHGEDLAGNIFSLLKELDNSYKNKYKVFLTANKTKKEKISALLNSYNLKNITLVDSHSIKFFKLLAKAKYLFADTSFPPRYIKKSGQIVTNTWHGTPLKMMGRDDKEGAFSMGNIQRNLLMSDYLIYPNEYMQQKMVSAYMLDGVYKGKILNVGYPRNSIFFDKQKAEQTKKMLGFENKTLFVYMPTWRGNLTNIQGNSQIEIITDYLLQIDKKMNDNQVLIAKLHSFVGGQLDYSKFKHIVPMPNNYDSYEVLNSADCLITDYSSVFYDFANSGKKIILFAYDEQEYMAHRGVYMSLDNLPFPKVKTVDQLYNEMIKPKEYDDSEFLKYCCTYECADTGKKILQQVLENKNVCDIKQIFDNSKKNVLIFTGGLEKNGITTAAISVLEKLSCKDHRYFTTFQQQVVSKEPERVNKIPENINILPMPTKPQYTIAEAMAMFLYYKLNLSFKPVVNLIDRMCKREIEKCFSGIDFSSVIQYEGYGKNMIHLFSHFKCDTTIFVHNNMQEELQHKNNQHRKSLQRAYQTYNHVACVTNDIVTPTEQISGRSDNIIVVNNCHSYISVKQRAEEEIVFDETTESNVELSKLKEILNSKSNKIINIGRFSAEKGHDMLIEAFSRFAIDNPDSYLIIIGGYGKLYDKTLKLAKQSPVYDKIIIIRSIQNPMPILKKCDLFILSSRYEGLGLTLLEADTLGVATISTNVCGPSGFMKEHGGFLVEPNATSIFEGMNSWAKGEVKPMNVDFEKYNCNAVEQFKALCN